MFIMTSSCFFFNDTATTEIYTLSLHDALPISVKEMKVPAPTTLRPGRPRDPRHDEAILAAALDLVAEVGFDRMTRSEEHTSELQSRQYLVCRLLLEKKKHKDHVRHVQHEHPIL